MGSRRIDVRDDGDWVHVAVPVALLRRLIGSGSLCAAEVRCLDGESKLRLQRICLENCSQCLSLVHRSETALPAATPRLDPNQGGSPTHRFR